MTHVVTASGQNFAATPIVTVNGQNIPVQYVDKKTLLLEVPGLPPGIYDLWIKNPDGRRNVHRGALTVGKQLYLPILAR